MIDIQLNRPEFFYLLRAVKRDLETLEEMAPWDIYDEQEAHADEVRLCKAVARLLHVVEQQRVIAH